MLHSRFHYNLPTLGCIDDAGDLDDPDPDWFTLAILYSLYSPALKRTKYDN
ncbi:hypothetical protein F441_07578, partial [Phytophthora nicotianae CJ01A1]